MTWQSQNFKGRWGELEDFYDYQLTKNNTMTFVQVKSAVVSGVIAGVLGVAMYVVGVGDLFKLDVHSIVNVFALAVLTTVVSLLKAVVTTSTGTVAGVQIR